MDALIQEISRVRSLIEVSENVNSNQCVKDTVIMTALIDRAERAIEADDEILMIELHAQLLTCN
jgi:hypothetical protein